MKFKLITSKIILSVFLFFTFNINAQTLNEQLINASENNNYKLCTTLIEKGADVNYSKNGSTPLHYACGYKEHPDSIAKPNLKLAQFFLSKGAHVNIKNMLNKTPYHYALEYGNDDLIKLLKLKYNEETVHLLSENALIKDELIMFDKIPLDSSHYHYKIDDLYEFYTELYFSSNNIDGVDIYSILLENLLDNSIKKYEYYFPYSNKYDEISNDVLYERVGEGYDSIHSISPETDDIITTVTKRYAKNSELNAIKFFDEWIFDEKNFKMYKKVKAYCPIRMEENYGGNVKFLNTGWFIFDDYKNSDEKIIVNKRMKHFISIKYEFLLINEDVYPRKEVDNIEKSEHLLYLEKTASPYWNSYNKSKFREIIIDRVLNAESVAYDFHTNKKLTVKEIRRRFGEEIYTFKDIDPESTEYVEYIYISSVDPYEILSVIFIEDWYIDTETGRIIKEVKGIAPVRTYYKSVDLDMRNPIREVPFVVWFNNN